jgi:RIO kinase 1
VLIAETEEGKKLAIKVYAIGAANFKRMQPYIIGDSRFMNIKKDKQSFVYSWCRKEFQNLQRAKNAGVSCPEVFAFAKNVLVMELLGNDMDPFPRLANSEIKNHRKLFKEVVRNLKLLYQKAGLVHTDLSEYNILIDDKEKPWLIDFSQSVMREHPNAEYFLRKDVKNICSYFNRNGIECDEEKLYDEIKGYKD